MASKNGLAVEITAVDKTAAVIDSLTKKFAGITAPGTPVTKSLARLSDASGVTRLSKAILHLGNSAASTGEQLASALGGIAPLTAALSLGGMAKMTSDWAKVTQGLSFDATRIGSTVGQLQALEGSARLSGASAEAASSGLRTLQDTLTDTVGGRNNAALVYMKQLGVAFDDGAGHALRATTVMPKLADALAKISDRSIRARVGTQLLGGAYEELAPWIDRGSKGMAENAELAKKYGVNTEESARNARTFGKAQTELEMAFQGLGNSISNNVSPALAGLMTTTANWIGVNRGMFALNIAGWGQDYSKAFAGIGGAVDKAVTSTLGWNRTLEIGIPLLASRFVPGVAALENALASLALVKMPLWLLRFLGSGPGLAASIIMNPSPTNVGEEKTPGYADRFGAKDPNTRAQKMMGYFEGNGWTHNQAAGIVANLARESDLTAGKTGDNGQAYGLAQWHPDRQANFAKWAGHDIRGSTLDEQMQFVQYELTHGEKVAGDNLRLATTPATAAMLFNHDYERPANVSGENGPRIAGAERYAAMPPSKVEISFSGLPAGAAATVTQQQAAIVRIVRSMEPAR